MSVNRFTALRLVWPPALNSIRHRLRLELLIVGLIIFSLGSLGLGRLIGSQVNDLLDYQLEQLARSLMAHDLILQTDDRPEDPARHLIIRIINPQGQRLYDSDDEVDITADAPLGFSDLSDQAGGYPDGLRVFTLEGPQNRIQIMQSQALRNALRSDATRDALWLALPGLLLLTLWVGMAVQRAFRPLDTLSEALKLRHPNSLTPVILTPCPKELNAPVSALNDLLHRLDQALQAQRRFTGDAAHELRTPLAALRLQVQNLAHADDPIHRTAQIGTVLKAIDRCTHLITQLLTLARADESVNPSTWAPVCLHAVAQDALVQYALEASHHDVELALDDASDHAEVLGQAGELQRLIGNLLSNAIKHSPTCGTVGVGLCLDGPHHVVLTVTDEGTGMPPAQRARAFDRFYRGTMGQDLPGAGLGLAIVEQIAERHSATVSLRDNPCGRGLQAEVRLPRWAAPTTVPSAIPVGAP